MVMVSHDAGTIERTCDRVILLSRGKPVDAGSPSDVIASYHDLLQAERRHRDIGAEASFSGSDLSVSARCETLHRESTRSFHEGDGMRIAIDVTPLQPAPATTIVAKIRSDSGDLVGGSYLLETRLDPGRTSSFGLVLEQLPLREGVFTVDLGFFESGTGATLVEHASALSFTVLSRVPGGLGPVALSGRWEEGDSLPNPNGSGS